MIFIQADTYEKARACAEMYGLENEFKEWKYIYSADLLRGLDRESATIWRYNGWWNHPYANEIYEEALTRGMWIYDKVEKGRADYEKHSHAYANRIMPGH